MAVKLGCIYCGTYNTAGTSCKFGGFESHTEVDAINFLKRISEAKSKDIALMTAENVRLQQEVIDLQAVIDASDSQEPVAWVTDDYLTDKSATTYSKEVALRWKKKGWPVDCLYAHPIPVLQAQQSQEVAVPDECCATGQSCEYELCTLNGEQQCKYCGKDHPDMQSPRITEQDAREIVQFYVTSKYCYAELVGTPGRFLEILNKLNNNPTT